MHRLARGLGLAGPAFSVLAEAGSIITVHKALLEAPAGTVVVAGGETARGLDGAPVTSSLPRRQLINQTS